MTRLIASLFAAAFFLVQGAFAQLETGPLAIDNGDSVHKFTVELANDPEEIRVGLMNRAEMAPNAGMLFDLGEPREASFWMKNTLIPLDMLFLDTDGKIIAIARNTVPGSLRSIGPGVPVKAVLELNGGRSEALGIEPGDVVEHALFGNLAQ
ncbi:DUF192 domain-containing protein [Hyphomonas oceanitis]|uniref:DUF192 domain-containing protein n=1 Tax=Hyphomonas oceanitis TaxID=81033 RepID=UPI00300163EE